MGMYTELVLGVEIKRDERVSDILKYMLGDYDGDAPRCEQIRRDLPPHEFFKTERWHWMLVSDSFYFDGQTDSKLYITDTGVYLNVRCNLKNYDNEISLFLDWLSPYIITLGFLGYERYEEFDHPTLIYNYGKDGIRYKHAGEESF